MHDRLNFILGEVRSGLRFRWFGLGLAAVLCLAGWLVVAILPNIYEAEARFSLNTTSLLERTLEEQIVATDPESRLTYIIQSLFGRAQLEEVARSTGLDAGISRSSVEYERMIDQLGEDIVFDPLTPAATPNTSDFYYELSYRHSDRDKAIAVVSAVFNTFKEDALGESRRDEDEALASLDREIATAESNVRRDEDALATFRRENADSQPGNEGDFEARLQTVELALDEGRRDLSSLQSRRDQDRLELERLSRVIPNSAAEIVPGSTQALLQQAKIELNEKSLRMQDTNREIVLLKARITMLEGQLREEREALGYQGADPGLLALEASPVYQAAQIALADTERNIAQLQAEITDLEADRTDLRSLRDQSLANETTLSALVRAVDDSRQQLDTFLERRRALARTMAVETSSPVRFNELDPPFASQTPVKPARLALLAAVFVVALIAGGGLCYGLAQLRPIFSSASSLQRFAELPVLGVVTNAWPAHEQFRYRRSVLAFSGACSLLILALIGVTGIELFASGGVHAPFVGN